MEKLIALIKDILSIVKSKNTHHGLALIAIIILAYGLVGTL